ncbi:unnamed protein product [Penicillium salamii]|nr:unnamed protein product [Penicillium salamii]CAG8392611.1 unnamed protein product [Penicillium salamii]
MSAEKSSTAVELHGHPAEERGPKSRGETTTAITSSSDDEVMQASRLADAEVPDGGYGWVVISACAVLTWWFIGTAYSWGIFQAALVREGLSSSSTLAFVGSLAAACISFFGILNARIIRKLGTVWSALVGIFLLGLGEVLSGFTTHNIGGLFMTAGVLMGAGTSLCFMVVSVIPAQYFKAKRGIAGGIVYAAGGLGGAAISFILDALVGSVGVQWTFRILGFMTWGTGIPAAFLIKQRVAIPPTAFIDWSLLRNSRFLLLFITGAIATFPLLVPPFFLPLYADSIGLSTNAGAGMVAAFNFSSALGRLLCGLCCDRLGPVNTLFMSVLLSGLSMIIIWPVSTSIGPLVVFVIVNGMANGGFFSTMPIVVGSVFGSTRVTVAMGMTVTGWAGGYLLGAPIAGYILDAYGGEDGGNAAYRPAIFYAGGMALAASITAILLRVKMDRRPLKKL